MNFPVTRTWFRTSFAKPFLVHRGVRVYYILHREGWPLDYHFSWQQARADGDRTLVGESFDIRKLPDYFERPGLASMPAGATVQQWRDEHHHDHIDQISWFIDECMSRGVAPWAGFKKPMIPWRTFTQAVADDVSEVWRYWFPTADDRAWRASLTYLDTHLFITRLSVDSYSLQVDGQHWRVNLRRKYPSSLHPGKALKDYMRFIRRTFKTYPGFKQWRILSMEASNDFMKKIDGPSIQEWAVPFAVNAQLRLQWLMKRDGASGDRYLAGVNEELIRKHCLPV